MGPALTGYRGRRIGTGWGKTPPYPCVTGGRDARWAGETEFFLALLHLDDEARLQRYPQQVHGEGQGEYDIFENYPWHGKTTMTLDQETGENRRFMAWRRCRNRRAAGGRDPEEIQAGQGTSGQAHHRQRAVLEAAPLAADGEKTDRAAIRAIRSRPAAAWLVNCILSKHADAMDCYPEPTVLPREPGDRAEAEADDESCRCY